MPDATASADFGVNLNRSVPAVTVWSLSATRIVVHVMSGDDFDTIAASHELSRIGDGVWQAEVPGLAVGSVYALSADGPVGEEAPRNDFDPDRLLLDPWGRGVVRSPGGTWLSSVVEDEFDWGEAAPPRTELSRTVIYEAHLKGLTRQREDLPEHLRGTYAGLAHESTIAYLKELGVTAVELLPIHAFVSEERLLRMGMVNYWGYNTISFFSPHPAYATEEAQRSGADAVLREFKGMVKHLHLAGIEVILDVVYNHTGEEGRGGPTTSFRGLDNATWYRQGEDGTYIDTTGCGNTLDTSKPIVRQMVLDSLRYWVRECRIDGFRFDLAASLARDEAAAFQPDHPLLHEILQDPELQGVKMIAEPWDVGIDGWQTGGFPTGWLEWNDRYRDRMRDFWLSDIARARVSGAPGSGIGRFATRFAGSSNTFSQERGPLASINFMTAHDGFTLKDLVSYNVKHNLLNGETNRDGSNNNNSFNHGHEGPSKDARIKLTRRKAVRNLLGTLLLSAGVPMLTAGDEWGRTQNGNNNAYCHDSELTWLDWNHKKWQRELHATTRKLLRLRRENPALRPERFAERDEHVPGASQMEWYDALGGHMTESEWNNPINRTLQYLATSTPVEGEVNRILLIVHALEDDAIVTLPAHPDVTGYTMLWNSADEQDNVLVENGEVPGYAPGTVVPVTGASMVLFRAEEARAADTEAPETGGEGRPE